MYKFQKQTSLIVGLPNNHGMMSAFYLAWEISISSQFAPRKDSEQNYAQTQFSVNEFRVQGQSSDFQCMRTTHYNEKRDIIMRILQNNAHSPIHIIIESKHFYTCFTH